MLGLAGPGGDRVDVQIKRRLDDPQTLDACLFGCLGQRHFGEVGDTVGVPARLEPTVQFHVVQNEGSVSTRVDHGG